MSDKSRRHGDDLSELPRLLLYAGGQRSSQARPHGLQLVVEEDDVVTVVPRQPLARPSVAHDQRLVHLAAVGYEDDVAEAGRLSVSGQLDAVGAVEPGHLLGVLAVVHELEPGEEGHPAAGLVVEGAGARGGSDSSRRSPESPRCV